ncbi:MAG: hypothetical protein K0R15_2241 [Clostridiales bacterium]|jgi:hypothetical protein|nr:hypothetical protein [Clostridiales bacterium]
MPRISCSVASCTHNNSGICRAGILNIGGRNARITEATCCETYYNKDGLSNSVHGQVSEGETKEIFCSVNTCTYNEEKRCILEEIEVSCLTEVEDYRETDCISYERRWHNSYF